MALFVWRGRADEQPDRVYTFNRVGVRVAKRESYETRPLRAFRWKHSNTWHQLEGTFSC